jgi:hypothetical protein
MYRGMTFLLWFCALGRAEHLVEILIDALLCLVAEQLFAGFL